MRIGLACEAGPPPADVLDLLEAAGLPVRLAARRGAAGAPAPRRRPLAAGLGRRRAARLRPGSAGRRDRRQRPAARRTPRRRRPARPAPEPRRTGGGRPAGRQAGPPARGSPPATSRPPVATSPPRAPSRTSSPWTSRPWLRRSVSPTGSSSFAPGWRRDSTAAPPLEVRRGRRLLQRAPRGGARRPGAAARRVRRAGDQAARRSWRRDEDICRGTTTWRRRSRRSARWRRRPPRCRRRPRPSSPTCAPAATRRSARRPRGSTAWSSPRTTPCRSPSCRPGWTRCRPDSGLRWRRPPPTSAPITSARRSRRGARRSRRARSSARRSCRWRAAGLYVPGGLADYPSSVLMTAIPAQVAGVERIVVCSPPRPGGGAAAGVAAACALLGLELLFPIGGAQAVAAMALGTARVPRCDVIVGPGNAYVTEAKRLLVGEVGIDSLAGPSEVLIIADASRRAGVARRRPACAGRARLRRDGLPRRHRRHARRPRDRRLSSGSRPSSASPRATWSSSSAPTAMPRSR